MPQRKRQRAVLLPVEFFVLVHETDHEEMAATHLLSNVFELVVSGLLDRAIPKKGAQGSVCCKDVVSFLASKGDGPGRDQRRLRTAARTLVRRCLAPGTRLARAAQKGEPAESERSRGLPHCRGEWIRTTDLLIPNQAL